MTTLFTVDVDKTATLMDKEQVQRAQSGVLGQYTTTNRDLIQAPYKGLMVYNTTTDKLNFYNGAAWAAVTSV
jgi:hypothetical protein